MKKRRLTVLAVCLAVLTALSACSSEPSVGTQQPQMETNLAADGKEVYTFAKIQEDMFVYYGEQFSVWTPQQTLLELTGLTECCGMAFNVVEYTAQEEMTHVVLRSYPKTQEPFAETKIYLDILPETSYDAQQLDQLLTERFDRHMLTETEGVYTFSGEDYYMQGTVFSEGVVRFTQEGTLLLYAKQIERSGRDWKPYEAEEEVRLEILETVMDSCLRLRKDVPLQELEEVLPGSFSITYHGESITLPCEDIRIQNGNVYWQMADGSDTWYRLEPLIGSWPYEPIPAYLEIWQKGQEQNEMDEAMSMLLGIPAVPGEGKNGTFWLFCMDDMPFRIYRNMTVE